jgi:hypothetical protein
LSNFLGYGLCQGNKWSVLYNKIDVKKTYQPVEIEKTLKQFLLSWTNFLQWVTRLAKTSFKITQKTGFETRHGKQVKQNYFVAFHKIIMVTMFIWVIMVITAIMIFMVIVEL